MALHGFIEVNNQRIGVWTARRLRAKIGPRNGYECQLKTHEGSVSFRITHAYHDGAAVLAGKVLTEGARRLREKAGNS